MIRPVLLVCASEEESSTNGADVAALGELTGVDVVGEVVDVVGEAVSG